MELNGVSKEPKDYFGRFFFFPYMKTTHFGIIEIHPTISKYGQKAKWKIFYFIVDIGNVFNSGP